MREDASHVTAAPPEREQQRLTVWRAFIGEAGQGRVTAQPFVPAGQLKQTYGVFGHFYTVELASGEVIACRSVLEIIGHDLTPADHDELSAYRPDAVFIMMNPGSSKPLIEVRNHIRAAAIRSLPISLVPTRPDTTQYQVMRVMHLRGWQHVRVLNLSDLRSPQSTAFIRTFERLENDDEFDGHSIFSDDREAELSLKLPRRARTPLVLAWGISGKLTPLVERCMARLPGTRRVFGLREPGSTNKYRHPLPSLQRDKQRWINQIIAQFENQRGD